MSVVLCVSKFLTYFSSLPSRHCWNVVFKFLGTKISHNMEPQSGALANSNATKSSCEPSVDISCRVELCSFIRQ